jgi:hypothetical protein
MPEMGELPAQLPSGCVGSSPEVIDGAEWKQASGSTPMPAHIRPQITDRVRLVCRRYERRA